MGLGRAKQSASFQRSIGDTTLKFVYVIGTRLVVHLLLLKSSLTQIGNS